MAAIHISLKLLSVGKEKNTLKRADKHYTLDIAGRPEVVSLDRLKPAYLESDLVTDVDTPTQATSTAPTTESPVTITRSGLRVRKPVRFS